MKKLWCLIGALLLLPTLALAASNTLTWQDNSDNESNFLIERTTASSVTACPTATGFTQIVSVGSNVVTFVDGAVMEGTTYCYRVRASNAGGVSAYSNIAGRTVPFTIPAAPSGLAVGP